jgi:hypothetical protein
MPVIVGGPELGMANAVGRTTAGTRRALGSRR